MSDSKVEDQKQQIIDANEKGLGATLATYTRLSGPGWLQSAITLGGGSLAGSLYLGVVFGYDMMWLQPLMMIFGVVMLSAIAYVVLSTGQRPFVALNQHVNPVLGWSWIIATIMANLVWAMPQFSLGSAALRQNLGILNFSGGEYITAILLFVIALSVVLLYDREGLAFKIFDYLLKAMVGLVVVSFFIVVVAMTFSDAGLPWGDIFAGFLPDPSLVFQPASNLQPLIEQSSAPEYWHDTVVSQQRDLMVAAAATAVGINMTFLLPYSMMKRRWDEKFRGLAKFDLTTGLFIPFVFATSCVVIAAASQFHANPEPGLIEMHQAVADDGSEAEDGDGQTGSDSDNELPEKLVESYEGNLNKMLEATGQDTALADIRESDRILAATLIKRDSFDLANSLEDMAGPSVAQGVFGVGVVGMAISSIIILMLINGFAVCEITNAPSSGWLYRIGCILPGLTGAFGALVLWGNKTAQFYLAVPTSRFGMVLLPIAYLSFLCLMNSRSLMGDSLPKGGSRIAWNTLMGIALALSMIGASISIFNDQAKIPSTEIPFKFIALGVVGALVVAGVVMHFVRMSVPAKRD